MVVMNTYSTLKSFLVATCNHYLSSCPKKPMYFVVSGGEFVFSKCGKYVTIQYVIFNGYYLSSITVGSHVYCCCIGAEPSVWMKHELFMCPSADGSFCCFQVGFHHIRISLMRVVPTAAFDPVGVLPCLPAGNLPTQPLHVDNLVEGKECQRGPGCQCSLRAVGHLLLPCLPVSPT